MTRSRKQKRALHDTEEHFTSRHVMEEQGELGRGRRATQFLLANPHDPWLAAVHQSVQHTSSNVDLTCVRHHLLLPHDPRP